MSDVCLDPSFEKRKDAEKFLLKHMAKYFYPVIAKVYTNHGLTKIKATAWLESAKNRTENHPSKGRLDQLISLISKELEKFPDYEVVKTHIHHDLHKGNILTKGERVTIIDWEGMIEG